MNGYQLMRLDSVGINIYDIHGYFRELMVGQWPPRFWVVTILQNKFICFQTKSFLDVTPQ